MLHHVLQLLAKFVCLPFAAVHIVLSELPVELEMDSMRAEFAGWKKK